MAVIYVNIKPDEKKADEDDKLRTLNDQYIVKTDNDLDDQATILNSSFSGDVSNNSIALPQVGDSHPTDSRVTVKNRSLEPTKNRKTWLMNVTYNDAIDSKSDPGGGGGGGPVVLKVVVDSWEETFIMEYDYAGERFKNSATDKIKYESIRDQIMITFSAQTKDPSFVKYQGLQGKVNSGPVNWLGFKFLTDQVLFKSYRATSVGNNTWQEDFVFKMKQVPDTSVGADPNQRQWGWQPLLLDAGFNELVDRNGQKELTPILSVQAQGDKKPPRPVSQEWPLDGAGEALAADQIDAGRIFLEFQAYSKTNFGAFNFDFESILTKNAQVNVGL